MNHRLRARGLRPVATVILILASVLPAAAAQVPAWWIARGTIDTNKAPNDFAPVTQGQALWMAIGAKTEFNTQLAELGGAEYRVDDVLLGVEPSENDLVPVTVGQLKSLALPFYERLDELAANVPAVTSALPIGVHGPLPWTPGAEDDADLAPANIGQLKRLFSFDFDRDGNGLPDWWEQKYFGITINPLGDDDHDGLNNRTECEEKTNPRKADSDDDGLDDKWELGHKLIPFDADSDSDGLPDGYEVLTLGTCPTSVTEICELGMQDVDIQTRHVLSDRTKAIAFAGFVTNGLPQFYLRQASWGSHSSWGADATPGMLPGFDFTSSTGTTDAAVNPTNAQRFATESFWSTNCACGPCTLNPQTNINVRAGEALWTNITFGTLYWGAATNRLEFTGQEPGVQIDTWQGEAVTPWPSGDIYGVGLGTESNRNVTTGVDASDISWAEDSEQESVTRHIRHAGHRRNLIPFDTALLIDLTTNALAAHDPWGGAGVPWAGGWSYDERGEQATNDLSVSTALLDISPDEVRCRARAMQYLLHLTNTTAGSVYRLTVAHFFTPRGSTQARLISSSNYVALGTGGALDLNPGGTLLPAPTEPGTNWINIVRARLIFDFDRNGKIDEEDWTRLKKRGGFRFWINDDRDVGDDSGRSLDDSPEGSAQLSKAATALTFRPRNHKDDRVNGLRDVVDFTPLELDIPETEFPPSQYSYCLRQGDSAIRFVYTSLAPNNAGAIHTNRISRCGRDGSSLLEEAPTHAVRPPAAAIGNLPECPLTGADPLNAGWLASNRVLVVEGTRKSQKPLILEISLTGKLVHVCSTPVSLSPVKDMFRYLNVRTNDVLFTDPDRTLLARAAAKPGQWATRLEEPPNWPDKVACGDNKPVATLVGIHGVNWDDNESPAGHSEIFKRFFQSGCDARYIGVSWAADVGRRLGMPLVFNADVMGAFVAAPYVADGLANFWGSNTTIFAHSLGNILASSLIVDHGITVRRYFMLDAALPLEAIDPNCMPWEAALMTPPAWKHDVYGVQRFNLPLQAMAAGWYKSFSTNDPRSDVRWFHRFESLTSQTKVWNLYSSAEDILARPNGDLPGGNWINVGNDTDGLLQKESVWVYNEMIKGQEWRLGAFIQQHIHGGWGYRSGWKEALSLEVEDLIARPVFKEFECEDRRCPRWAPAEAWIYNTNGDDTVTGRLPSLPFVNRGIRTDMAKIKNHAKLLAEAVPALSGPAGSNWSLACGISGYNMNLDSECRSTDFWPSRSGTKRNRWLHCDYMYPALPYVTRLYVLCSQAIKERAP